VGRGWNRVSDERRSLIRRVLAGGGDQGAAAAAAGVTIRTVQRVVHDAGGMPVRGRGCRGPSRLSVDEREEIMVGLAKGWSCRRIAVGLGRDPSTVSREVAANGGSAGYRAWRADQRADQQARRPRPTKLSRSPALVAAIELLLELRWSPEQIAARLPDEFPDDPEMRVSHETIYTELYVQGRGNLRRELAKCLRSGRARRCPRGRAVTGAGRIRDMVSIKDRPDEVTNRDVPGHWEGDLILGSQASCSAIGTLVERATRFVMLFPLGNSHTADRVRDGLAATMSTLPDHLRRTLTWDQGSEMAAHREFTVATGIDVYFCDPHSPWQRGSNENTNGLLRQFFPKGTDLSTVNQADCDAVALLLNTRPRKTLGWRTPREKLDELLTDAQTA
jgi:IS30 family transposase